MKASSVVLSFDDIYPRDAEHRFRLYARKGRDLDVLAAGESVAAVGLAIQTLHEDEKEHGRRFMDLGATGIYDAVESEWIVLPWHRSRS